MKSTFLIFKHYLEFPLGCNSYHGPHTINCWVTVWEEAGCTTAGQHYPTQVSRGRSQEWGQLNLR